MSCKPLAAAIGLAAAALLALASPALARDRNHDRIPDRWERAHHLSLKVNQARRDQDRDGLRNRGEFRAHLNPRDADSDDDGIEDGDEHAGQVASFSGGVLTISLAGGGTLTGKVDEQTEIECEDAARASHHGDDDNRGDDEGDDDQGDDDQGEDEDDCGPEALMKGAQVQEAELRTRGGSAVFTEIELGS